MVVRVWAEGGLNPKLLNEISYCSLVSPEASQPARQELQKLLERMRETGTAAVLE
jgi:hypothetical protein